MKKIAALFYFILLIVFPLALFSQSKSSTFKSDSYQKNIEDIMNTDREFNKMCEEKGMAKSFIAFAANEVIKMQNKQFAILGKDSLIANFDMETPDDFKLSWEPIMADVSASGDLGYTFGRWIFAQNDKAGKDKKHYGEYVTIWKKQKDNTWKYVLDGGNTTPEPKK